MQDKPSEDAHNAHPTEEGGFGSQLRLVNSMLTERNFALNRDLSRTQREMAEMREKCDKLRLKCGTLAQEKKRLSKETKRLAVHASARSEQCERFAEFHQLLRQTREQFESHRAAVLGELKCVAAVLQSAAPKAQLWTKAIESRQSDLRKRLEASETERRKLHEELMTARGNIRVFCRVRPLRRSISNFESPTLHEDIGGGDSVVQKITPKSVSCGRHSFQFDCVFGPEATQQQVYQEVAPLVTSCLDGYKVCIFAYGQTGSGKTYTMQGPDNRGVNGRALSALFAGLAQYARSQVHLSVVEIYNDCVRDLLVETEDDTGSCASGHSQYSQSDPLSREVRIASDGSVSVPNLCRVAVSSHAQVQRLLERRVYPRRSTGDTSLNAHSSRSHLLVFVDLTVHTSEETRKGRLVLIDLAGSERVSRSNVKGASLREAQHINKSLSALGDVVSALQRRQAHVPFRNSRLTALLSDSLGGTAKTLMFCQISPDETDLNETLCSLKFASRVRATTLGVAQRDIKVDPHVIEHDSPLRSNSNFHNNNYQKNNNFQKNNNRQNNTVEKRRHEPKLPRVTTLSLRHANRAKRARRQTVLHSVASITTASARTATVRTVSTRTASARTATRRRSAASVTVPHAPSFVSRRRVRRSYAEPLAKRRRVTPSVAAPSSVSARRPFKQPQASQRNRNRRTVARAPAQSVTAPSVTAPSVTAPSALTAPSVTQARSMSVPNTATRPATQRSIVPSSLFRHRQRHFRISTVDTVRQRSLTAHVATASGGTLRDPVADTGAASHRPRASTDTASEGPPPLESVPVPVPPEATKTVVARKLPRPVEPDVHRLANSVQRRRRLSTRIPLFDTADNNNENNNSNATRSKDSEGFRRPAPKRRVQVGGGSGFSFFRRTKLLGSHLRTVRAVSRTAPHQHVG
ncbi:MAG: hypothetical protein MHM6MM_000376 [Cercozoa sp. M6MM]